MDFVVSKVAMSICALLVLATLAGAFDDERLLGAKSELDSILDDLSIVLEKTWTSHCEISTSWMVPFLSNGEVAEISIHHSILRTVSKTGSSVLETSCPIHTWAWNGTALNSSQVEALDESSVTVWSSSGHEFRIATRDVLYEDNSELFLFVGSAR